MVARVMKLKNEDVGPPTPFSVSVSSPGGTKTGTRIPGRIEFEQDFIAPSPVREVAIGGSVGGKGCTGMLVAVSLTPKDSPHPWTSIRSVRTFNCE